MWPIVSWHSEIDCTKNELMELNDFWQVGTNSGKQEVNDFWLGLVKNGHDFLVHETLKSAIS